MKQRPEVSLVVPVLNEEAIIPELVKRSMAAISSIDANAEMILVDDGSTDGTLEAIQAERAKDPRVRYVSLSRNFGHQMAITAGLDAAQGNSVAIMDGDLQDPPELIPELHAKYKEGFHVVYAKRRARLDEVFWKKWAAAIFYRLLQSITRIDIPLDTGDFRLISRKVLLRLGDMRERDRFLRGQIAWLGFKTDFVLYDRHGRAAGERKYTVRKLMGLAMAGILSFSSFPLRLATFFGFFVSFFAFIIILYAIWSKITQGDLISGWTSMIISTMFIGGVQLICLGIIGEYINRISQEVRGRPMYVVGESSEGDASGVD
ncbi:MAG: glycosyltransferase family 2 protein [Flavobacteriales bacterium]|nr:glycosyltransferase family 2 protein [Flavobacteriales bacterium]